MYISFNAFTRLFFYLFICYHYAKYHYPEKTQQFLIFVCYNSICLYSKLQILTKKKLIEIHNKLVKYEEYQKWLSFIQKINNILNTSILKPTLPTQPKKITIDFVIENEVTFSFEKEDFLNNYLKDFFPDENYEGDNENDNDNDNNESLLSLGKKALEQILLPQDENENEDEEKNDMDNISDNSNTIIDYDFIILNGENNLKKIIKNIDSIKKDFVAEYSIVFQFEPFLHKPILCEFLNADDTTPTKIDFCDNNKKYDFFVLGNVFDRTFLTFFLKKYYNITVKDDYILKILDNNVNTLMFESSDILKLDDNCISKIKTNL